MTSLQRVITFATGKGGTGKTSCAANVAGLAAAAGWRTLLIDFDPQGNCAIDLGYTDRTDDGAHIFAALANGVDLTPVLRDVRPNLDVIPGGERLDDLDDVVAGRERRGGGGVGLLQAALEEIAPDYDLIIIDTPPSRRSALVHLALAAARWVVVPTKTDRASIEGLRVLANQLVVTRALNPDIEVLGVVLFGVKTSASVRRRNASEDINNVLGGAAPLFDSVIRDASAVSDESRDKGRLVHELAEVVHNAEPYWIALKEGRRPERVPGSAPALAEDYALLAQEMLTRIAAMEEESVMA